MRRTRMLALLLSTIVASGCSVRFSQLDTVRRLMPAELLASSNQSVLADYEWIFEFSGVRYSIYPVAARGRNVIFRGRSNLEITWDGESIIVIDGIPGAFGRFESGVEGSERWYAVAGRSVVRATCSPRRDWRLTNDRRGWRQECLGLRDGTPVSTQHLVELDKDDQIRLIESTIVPGAAPLRLVRSR
jgi:hypothetical protein